MTTETTPVFTQREPELLGQTVIAIGRSAGIGLEVARRARAAAKREVAVGLAQSLVEQFGEFAGISPQHQVDIARCSRAVTHAQFHRDPALGREHCVPLRVHDASRGAGEHHRRDPQVEPRDRLTRVLLPLRDQLFEAGLVLGVLGRPAVSPAVSLMP